MIKVVDIQSEAAAINEETIEILEEALAQAKDGTITEALFVGFSDNGNVTTRYSSTMNFILRLGALEWIKMRWNNEELM